MMYRISFEIKEDNLAVFLREVAPHLGTMEIRSLDPPLSHGTTIMTPPPAPRERRPIKVHNSKVNDRILETIGTGSATVQEIKTDLEKVGLSPNSISTGLTFLMKSQLVKRISKGVYTHVNYSAIEPENAA
jgi:hypothetical protein